MVKDDLLIEALLGDYREANLNPRTRAMLDHAALLNNEPRSVTAAHLERLREVGLTDQGILQVTQVTAFFNWTNRISMGLGLEYKP